MACTNCILQVAPVGIFCFMNLHYNTKALGDINTGNWARQKAIHNRKRDGIFLSLIVSFSFFYILFAGNLCLLGRWVRSWNQFFKILFLVSAFCFACFLLKELTSLTLGSCNAEKILGGIKVLRDKSSKSRLQRSFGAVVSPSAYFFF